MHVLSQSRNRQTCIPCTKSLSVRKQWRKDTEPKHFRDDTTSMVPTASTLVVTELRLGTSVWVGSTKSEARGEMVLGAGNSEKLFLLCLKQQQQKHTSNTAGIILIQNQGKHSLILRYKFPCANVYTIDWQSTRLGRVLCADPAYTVCRYTEEGAARGGLQWLQANDKGILLQVLV